MAPASVVVIPMNTLTADTSLQHSLASVSGLTEVRDAQGIVLGYYSPATHTSPAAYAEAAAHFDPVEMQRRKSSQAQGRTTNEVLSRIAMSDK